jgi:hypothetical protein
MLTIMLFRGHTNEPPNLFSLDDMSMHATNGWIEDDNSPAEAKLFDTADPPFITVTPDGKLYAQIETLSANPVSYAIFLLPDPNIRLAAPHRSPPTDEQKRRLLEVAQRLFTEAGYRWRTYEG